MVRDFQVKNVLVGAGLGIKSVDFPDNLDTKPARALNAPRFAIIQGGCWDNLFFGSPLGGRLISFPLLPTTCYLRPSF